MSSTHELPTQLFRSLQAVLMGAGAAGLMSLTSLVPFSVPSLFHSSTPCLPSSAAKNTCLPMTVTVSGWLQPLGMPQSPWSQRAPGGKSGLMSLTSLVPFSVPSVFHSSSPCFLSHALKNVVLGAVETMSSGSEVPGPGTMSLTSLVPHLVPSLFHSSSPYLTVVAWKKIHFLVRNTLSGADEPVSVFSIFLITRGPGSMSLTSFVPGFVPLLLHSSSPNLG